MSERKFSPGAEEALRLSQESASELGHGYVGTEHLLAGLLREGNNICCWASSVRREERPMRSWRRTALPTTSLPR